jgi:hypothetical protein
MVERNKFGGQMDGLENAEQRHMSYNMSLVLERRHNVVVQEVICNLRRISDYSIGGNMKSLCTALAAVTVLLVQSVFAQSSSDSTVAVDGFWGMKFGSTQAQCKKTLLSKQDATIDSKHTDADQIVVEGLTFGGREVSFIKLSFYKDELHTASVYYKAPLDAKTQDLYDDIKADLNQKYFVTTQDYRNFNSPYTDGDGYEMDAVRQGLATISAYWHFNRADGFKNVISLEIDEHLFVILGYQDGKLIKEAVNAEKEKNSKDY